MKMESTEFVAAVSEAAKELGREGITACHEIFLYGSGPRTSQAAAFGRAIQFMEEVYPSALRFSVTNTMKSPREISPGSGPNAVLNFATSLEVKPPKLAGLQFHSGKSAEEYGVPSLAYFSELQFAADQSRATHSYLRLCLPTSPRELDSQSLQSISRELASMFGVLGMHVGWSYYWSGVNRKEDVTINGRLPLWLRRFPGVAFGDPLGLLDFVEEGLLNVSWLTYVSAELAQRKGTTLERLSNDLLAAGVDFEVIDTGLLEVRAGIAPETGDINRGNKLPRYAKAAQALGGLALSNDMAQYLPIAEFEFADRVRWYRRFFDQ